MAMLDRPSTGPDRTGGLSPRRARRAKALVVVVVVVVVVMVVAVGASVVTRGLWRSRTGWVTTLAPDDAPFAYPGRDSVSAPAPVGVPLSFGSLLLGNTTNEPITITAVRVLEADDGVTVLGVKLDDGLQRKAEAIGSQAGFPAPNPGSEYQDAPVVVETAGLAPRGVDVVVGVQANRPGRWRARGIEISYRRGGRDYVTTYRNTFVVCTDMTVPCENAPQMSDV